MKDSKEKDPKEKDSKEKKDIKKEEYKGKTSVIIYPAYLNSKFTVSHGRRLSKTSAIENPTINEIGMALTRLSLPTEFEVCAHIATQIIPKGLDEPRQIPDQSEG